MRRYVISAPRSGLNWLRYCIEHHYGVPTPGLQRKLHDDTKDTPDVFIRSHDPLWAGAKKNNDQYRRIDPAETAGGTLVLILRHPLETFVRMAERRMQAFATYPSNIQFYTAAAAKRKAVFFYEDLVTSPAVMAQAMTFLDIQPAHGRPVPTLAAVEDEWADLAARSRESYDTQTGGGARTKDNPQDFEFHQRSLWWWQRRNVWRHLENQLSPAEITLLERYR